MTPLQYGTADERRCGPELFPFLPALPAISTGVTGRWVLFPDDGYTCVSDIDTMIIDVSGGKTPDQGSVRRQQLGTGYRTEEIPNAFARSQ